ncbi:hypothetical protein PSECIP111951_02535 [Pseudoalteromonas holothuriae]|uniref:Lacal_2735 family protein n=1 Tax=Pseudoalteromonas holothuriae TaxID=2963714 RepID=A0A9W4R0Q2_9GAMM|nr:MULTISPECIES: DUF6435 family protein [unclassified Pseudoalteromonas]CAH9061663.1 hypothetical protein PSECIP111951_02535 [Pseudoalteromonas sp. CIP111951]CAH9061951.1 hypothetical protein PSECIP111854_02915 [Pseudoalteromonas sp. CIP111854]
MFSFFKRNPTKKLEKQLAMLQEQAMHAQRRGDIRTYSTLTAEADDVYKKIQDIETSTK